MHIPCHTTSDTGTIQRYVYNAYLLSHNERYRYNTELRLQWISLVTQRAISVQYRDTFTMDIPSHTTSDIGTIQSYVYNAYPLSHNERYRYNTELRLQWISLVTQRAIPVQYRAMFTMHIPCHTTSDTGTIQSYIYNGYP